MKIKFEQYLKNSTEIPLPKKKKETMTKKNFNTNFPVQTFLALLLAKM